MLIMDKSVADALIKMKDGSSKDSKLNTIKQFADNREMVTILKFLLTKTFKSGISHRKFAKETDEKRSRKVVSLIELLEYVADNNTGTQETINIVHDAIKEVPDEYKEYVEQIVTQSLRLGVTANSVSKVLPDAFDMYGVMLATRYKNGEVKPPKDFTITTKYDGIRATIKIDDDGSVLCRTRTGKVIEGLDKQISQLEEIISLNIVFGGSNLRGRMFDGELIHKDFEDYIMAGVGDEDKVTKIFQQTQSEFLANGDKPNLVFMMFDCVDNRELKDNKYSEPYSVRRGYLDEIEHVCNNSESIRVATKLYSGSDPNKIEEHLNSERILGMSLEGIMINDNNAPYATKRTRGLFKYKAERFYELSDFIVTGFFEGKKHSKYEGLLGGLIVDVNGREVKVGSGIPDNLRSKIWKNTEGYLGKMIVVQHAKEIGNKNDDTLSLRLPVFKGFRDDKKLSDKDIL